MLEFSVGNFHYILTLINLSSCCRKLCRGFVPDQKWLHLGLCIATLFDALPDQPSVKLSSVVGAKCYTASTTRLV